MPTSTATKIAFVRDERTENWLRSEEVKFTGPSPIRVSEVDRKSSRANQARDLAILPEAVQSYRQALRSGQNLPAIVVYRRANKWMIVDGNNRDQAALDEHFDMERAYILDNSTPSETLLLLTVAANTRNGVRVSESWSLQNAVYLVNLGYTREAVAKALSVSTSAIATHEKDAEAAKRARKLKISGWDTMTMRIRQLIARIPMDKPFIVVAEAAITTKPSYTPEFGEMISSITRASSEEEAISIAIEWADAVLAQYKADKRMGKRGSHTRNVRLSLVSGLGKISAFDMSVFNATFASDQDREILTGRINAAIAKLCDMSYHLNGRDKTEDTVLAALQTVGTDN